MKELQLKFFRKLYRFLRHRILDAQYRAADFRSSKRDLLRSNELSDKEKAWLDGVSLEVSPADGMYVPKSARHYLSVGLSAVRCIEAALCKSNRDKIVDSVLDFPCGHGRVLRFLKLLFPDADFTAVEIDPGALEFCRKTFSVNTEISNKDFNKLSITGKFDLIWSGSLITHVDEKTTMDLLKFYQKHLSPNGLCVFTTHGQASIALIQDQRKTYGLTMKAQQGVLSQFHERGYGYEDYEGHHGYGVSVVSYNRMNKIAQGVGQWKNTFFLEQGWDNHQDVYGFTNAEPDSRSRIG